MNAVRRLVVGRGRRFGPEPVTRGLIVFRPVCCSQIRSSRRGGRYRTPFRIMPVQMRRCDMVGRVTRLGCVEAFRLTLARCRRAWSSCVLGHLVCSFKQCVVTEVRSRKTMCHWHTQRLYTDSECDSRRHWGMGGSGGEGGE